MIVPNRVLPSLGQVRLADENQVEPLDLRFVSSVLSAREQKNWREKQLQANLYKELRAMQTPAGPENGIGGFTPYNPYMQKAQDAYMNNYNQILDHASQTMDNVKDPLEVEKVLFQGAQKLFTPEYRQAYAQSKQFETYLENFAKNPDDYDSTELYNTLNDFYLSQDAFDMSRFRSTDLVKVDLADLEDKFFKGFKAQKDVEYKDIGGGAMGVVKSEYNIDPNMAADAYYDRVSSDPLLVKKYKNAGLEGDDLKEYLRYRASGALGTGTPEYDEEGNVIARKRVTDITNVNDPANSSAGSSEAEREIAKLLEEDKKAGGNMTYREALDIAKGRGEYKAKEVNTIYSNDPNTTYTINGKEYSQVRLTAGNVNADIAFWGSGLSDAGDGNHNRPRQVKFESNTPGSADGVLWTNDPQMLKEWGVDYEHARKREEKYVDNELGEWYGIPATAHNPAIKSYDSSQSNNTLSASYSGTPSAFSDYIGFQESNNNYGSVNRASKTGAWGKHNFIWSKHKDAIQKLASSMGITIEKPEDYWSHPALQEAYFAFQNEALYTPALPDMRAAAASSSDPWIQGLSDDELKYIFHHEGSLQDVVTFLKTGVSRFGPESTAEIRGDANRKGAIQRLRDQFGTAGAGQSLFKSNEPEPIPDIPRISMQMGDDIEADSMHLLKLILKSPKQMIQSAIYLNVMLAPNFQDPDKPFMLYELLDNGETQPKGSVSFDQISKYFINE